MSKFSFDTISELEVNDIERLANVVRSSELYRKYAKNVNDEIVPVNVAYRKAVVKFRLTDFAYKVSDDQIKKDVIKLADIVCADAAKILGKKKVFCCHDFNRIIMFGIRNNHKPKKLTVPKKCGVWLKPAADIVMRFASVLGELFRLVDNYNTFSVTFYSHDAAGRVNKTSLTHGISVPSTSIDIGHRDFATFREASRILANVIDDDYNAFYPDHATIEASDTGDVYEVDF